MDDIAALFESVDGIKEDLMDFSVAGISAVGANLAYGYVEKMLVKADGTPMAPPWVMGPVAILAGVLGGSALAKVNRNVATGVAVGLAARGVTTLAKAYAPSLPLAGLSDSEYRLLGPGMAEAPVMVEQVAGLNGSTQTIENVAGLASTIF